MTGLGMFSPRLLVQVQAEDGTVWHTVLSGATVVCRGLIDIRELDELMLTDEYVSPRHCRIWPEDGGWWVEDCGSTNGTWVVDPARVPVVIGDGFAARKAAILAAAGVRADAPVRLGAGWQIRVGHSRLIVVPVIP